MRIGSDKMGNAIGRAVEKLLDFKFLMVCLIFTVVCWITGAKG